jgi:Reverse transcriptase (RNA-dependent DNA polymerase)
LRSSGLRWHEQLADVLRSIGFSQCKVEADLWMRENDGLYEYIAVYVDDLLLAARNPSDNVKVLKENLMLKLKGVGPLTYHLACDYFQDKDGALCYGPRKYISKMIGQFENMIGCKPREYTLPLDKGDHPEGIKKYQTMIGYLQGAVSLGRFDIQTATMTMSRLREAP